jgi:hypothetical protein
MMNAQLRITKGLFERLTALVFTRYPDKEWATFLVFGFRQTKETLVLTAVDLIEPGVGDLDTEAAHVVFRSQYSVRAALTIESGPLCVGVAHSHPRAYRPFPSKLDDDMDGYFSDYFKGFTKSECYCSLIFALTSRGDFTFSGRGRIDGRDFHVQDLVVVGDKTIERLGPTARRSKHSVTDRLERVYGREARERLENSSVTIVGCGGTGSAVAHILARAGIRKLILVDYDRFEESNLERLHGSDFADVRRKPYKVRIVERQIKLINPKAEVVPIVGNILQGLPRDYAVASDLVFCCTDSTHSRAAVSELAYRYLVPTIDIGVQLDGKQGKVTAEVGQFTIYSPDLPCAYCRHLIDTWWLSVELMSEEEKQIRKKEATAAAKRGDDAGAYWRDLPEFHTVGHLTTFAAALAVTYGIGWLTGKFHSSATFFQFDLLAEELGYVSVEMDKRPQCPCAERIGYADQGSQYTVVTAPSYWPAARIV